MRFYVLFYWRVLFLYNWESIFVFECFKILVLGILFSKVCFFFFLREEKKSFKENYFGIGLFVLDEYKMYKGVF